MTARSLLDSRTLVDDKGRRAFESRVRSLGSVTTEWTKVAGLAESSPPSKRYGCALKRTEKDPAATSVGGSNRVARRGRLGRAFPRVSASCETRKITFLITLSYRENVVCDIVRFINGGFVPRSENTRARPIERPRLVNSRAMGESAHVSVGRVSNETKFRTTFPPFYRFSR